jgi:hypothetical protein
MPSINFDDDPESTFEEIKSIKVSSFRKLFKNKIICKEILPILFPQNKSLKLLHQYFSQQKEQHNIYKTLSNNIMEYIELS